MRKRVLVGSVLLAAAMPLSACMSDRATTGALLGGTTGAVIGGVATNSAGGAVAGAAIGGVGGAMIGEATRPKCYYSQYYGRTVCRN